MKQMATEEKNERPEVQTQQYLEADIDLVVGLGASAGGLEALEAFFSHLPSANGIAFVVIIHLAPDKASSLADILQGQTPLPVAQVTEKVHMEAGHIYVIPPNKNLLVRDGCLYLEPIEDERQQRAPVDHFFRTLADAYDGHAVGVILSGTGANGSVGARLLKEQGGLVLVQQPEEAPYSEMPHNALITGVADLALPVSELGKKLVVYRDQIRQARGSDPAQNLPEDGVKVLHQILDHLRTRTGHDFASYKRSTILRRLARRMHVTGTNDFEAYLAYLRQHPDESYALLDDLLISVTNFFRDPESFSVFEEKVIPSIFEGKAADDEIRVWVPGCATGEEAYSIAMLLAEYASPLDEPPTVQIFATDLNEAAIQVARHGVYPKSIEADVSAERLNRFFTKVNDTYHVRKELRATVLFAPQNLLSDPPFSHIDLVSCRNVLIYLQRTLQHKVMELFHYALAPGGYLFLGSSETTDGATNLYRTVDNHARLYQRRNLGTPLPEFSRTSRFREAQTSVKEASFPLDTDRLDDLLQKLQAEVAPPGLLVNTEDEVVQLTEAATPFLRLKGGVPSQNVLKLIHPALQFGLQAALIQTRQEKRVVATKPVRVEMGGQAWSIRLQVRPVGQDDLLHVVFERLPAAFQAEVLEDPNASWQILQGELQETREQLHLILEGYDTSREELRAQNEELESMNEELRSTAEELETSKEEAQSAAEELQTVNHELKSKVEEVTRAKSDLENLMVSTEIAMLFLDRELRIKRFTPPVGDLFHIRSSDVGRPLSDLSATFSDSFLAEDAEAVLETLEVRAREACADKEGRWFLMHTRPYRTVDDRIDGVVITFVDITERKRAEEQMQQARFYAENIVISLPEPLLVLTSDLRVKTANEVFYETFEVEPAQIEGRLIYELGNRQWDIPDLRRLLENMLQEEDIFSAYEVTHDFEQIGPRTMLLSARRLDDDHLILLLRDISARKKAEAALRQSEKKYRALFNSIDEGFCVLERITDTEGTIIDYRYLETNPAFEIQSGLYNVVGKTLREAIPGDNAYQIENLNLVTETGEPLRFVDHVGALGRWYDVYAFSPDDWKGHKVAVLFIDITERLHAENALRESVERFQHMANTVPDVLFTLGATGEVTYVSHRMEEYTGQPPSTLLSTVLWPDLIHPDDLVQTKKRWQWALTHIRPFEVRHRLRMEDGSYYWFITRARPIHDEEGTLMQWFGALTDVDRLVHTEQALQALNQTLEDHVAERTAQVHQLMKSLTLAEQEERSRVAEILHDELQQILYGLGMTLELLRNPSSKEEERELREQVDDILEQAENLTRSLSIDLSPPVLRSKNLRDLLDWLAIKKEEMHGLKLDVEVRGELRITDHAMRVLLYRSLHEILFNIVKHAGVDHARVVAWQAEDTLLIRVEDDGIGFDMALKKAAQADRGFGLPSVKERLELIGARFNIESAPGKGTRIRITLPLAEHTPKSK